MRIGTKSVLYGAHCVVVHPWFLAVGLVETLRVPLGHSFVVAFWLHDVGYFSKGDMDGLRRGNTRGAWRQNHGLPLR